MTPVTGKNQHRLMSMSWRQRAKVRGQVLDHPSWPAAAAVPAAPATTTTGGGRMMAGGHGQDGQGQEIGGDGMTTSGDGPKSTPDIFQIRKFVPQPNS